MCGIFGVFSSNQLEVSSDDVKRLTDMLSHRGPDMSGTICKDTWAFGHTRLSILDLSESGKQPMQFEHLTITFNGEIYNYQELQEELKKLDYTFQSTSDTEVILKAYHAWGSECLKKFNGMFALAIIDNSNNELFVARDRLGIKPLLYAVQGKSFLFSSEAKCILNYPRFQKAPDLIAISNYLSFRYPLADRSFFRGIKTLLPGHYLKIKNDLIEITQYWDLPLEKQEQSEDQWRQETHDLVTKAIERRMIADVPIGAYLSGGLDSSIITACMAKHQTVKTYTIGFTEEGYNEFNYAKQVADMYKTDHKEIILSAEKYLETMEHLINIKDAPLGVPNEVPLYLMSKKLREDIIVVLSGEGADELFHGYGRLMRSPYDYERLKEPNAKLKYPEIWAEYGRSFENPMEHFLFKYSYFKTKEKISIFNTEMKAAVNNDTDINKVFTQAFKQCESLSYYDAIPYVFEKLHLPGLLWRVDNSTMATAVEARVPFVDHELIEHIFKMPYKFKMAWTNQAATATLPASKISEVYDTPKHILREAFKDDLPQDILTRKKKGFPVPLDKWFRGDFSKHAKEMLLSEDSKSKVFLDQQALAHWMEENSKEDDALFGQRVWMLLNIEIWMRQWDL